MAAMLARLHGVVLLLALLAGGAAAASVPERTRPPALPLRRRGGDKQGDAHVWIAFVNDVHNRLEEEEPTTATPCSAASRALGRCVGGWPRIATELKALRRAAAEAGAGFVFLDAGDEFTGTLWDEVYQGRVTALVQSLPQLRPDAMVLGNHEFDAGLQPLAAYIKALPGPMLGACNVDASNEPLLRGLLQRFVVLPVKAGGRTWKVGVLGWTTPDTAATAPSVGGARFSPVLPSVRTCLAALHAQHPGLDVVVGLSHAGYASDLDTAASLNLSGRPGLDLIIGGHSHTFLYPGAAGPVVTLNKPGLNATNCVELSACDKPAGPYPTWAGRGAVPVVQAYYSSKYLGLVKLDMRQRRLLPGVLPLLLGGANSSRPVAPDPAVLALLRPYSGPVQALEAEVAGSTRVPLLGDAPVIRRNETNLGNWVCEALLAHEAAARANVSICLMVAGGIRSGIAEAPSNITVAQVLAMLPYANANAVFTVTGAVLLDALRHGLSGYTTQAGRFLQVAGLRVLHRDGALVSASLLDAAGATRAIAPSQAYTVTATDYMLQGGDGFAWPGAAPLLPSGTPYAQLAVDALQRAQPQGIAPTTHDRIVNCVAAPGFLGCS